MTTSKNQKHHFDSYASGDVDAPKAPRFFRRIFRQKGGAFGASTKKINNTQELRAKTRTKTAQENGAYGARGCAARVWR